MELHGKLAVLRNTEAGRTVGGAVECVEINRNAKGEDSPLGIS
jgi:hypothetical protein